MFVDTLVDMMPQMVYDLQQDLTPLMLLNCYDTLKFITFMMLSTVVQTMVGFGGGLIVMPLGMTLLPAVDVMASIILPFLFANFSILAKDSRYIHRDIFFLRVLPWMGMGVAIGLAMTARVKGNELKRGLGMFILACSFSKLYELFSVPKEAKNESNKPKKAAVEPEGTVPFVGLFLAGLLHGLYSTGGPLLVWSIGRANLDRNAFRGTMAAVWVLVSLLQAVGLFAMGAFNIRHILLGIALLPGTSIGAMVGNFTRDLLPERELKIFIYGTLAASGATLLR